MSAEEIPCPAELDFDEAKNAALGCLLSLSKITSGPHHDRMGERCEASKATHAANDTDRIGEMVLLS